MHPGLQPSAVASLKPNALERRAIPKYFFEPIYSQDFINERIHRTGEQAENIDAIFLFCDIFGVRPADIGKFHRDSGFICGWYPAKTAPLPKTSPNRSPMLPIGSIQAAADSQAGASAVAGLGGYRSQGKRQIESWGIPESALTYCDGHHSVKIHLGLLRKYPGAFAPSRIHRLPRLGPPARAGLSLIPPYVFEPPRR